MSSYEPQEVYSNPGLDPKPGALRYRGEDGKLKVCNPGDSLFSVVSFIATHYWDGEWKPIKFD